MGLFSKDSQVLDGNTVRYMMDGLQDIINEKQSTINKIQEQMEEKILRFRTCKKE